MQFTNLMVALCMLLLGYGVFVFIAETYNPLAIPAKENTTKEKRRYHLFGILAGCLVVLSSLAAWVLSSNSFFEGLKASFILATIALLLLLVAHTALTFFGKSQDSDLPDATQSLVGEENQVDVDLVEDVVTHDVRASIEHEFEEKIALMESEHNTQILEKNKTIETLESSIAELKEEKDVLTEKAVRVDSVEAELNSVKNEITTLKETNQDSKGVLESTIEDLKAENINLRDEAEQVNDLKRDLENSRVELTKLKSDYESEAKLREENEQREKELQYKLHHAALKERVGRLKMEVSAKRALGIARQAVTKLDRQEKNQAK